MFVRRRRPLLGAAMVGGTAYVAGKAGARRAQEEGQAAQMEADQEARLSQLEAQQTQQTPQTQAPATAPPTGGPTRHRREADGVEGPDGPGRAVA